MLLGLDDVSPLHNSLASLSVWILLAGYIVFPATFNKLQNEELDEKANTNLKQHALRTVRNVPLLYIAAFACGLGVVGCLWLWWKHRKNYVWVINRIFLPALLNSIAGLISTIVNIYSAQDGTFYYHFDSSAHAYN
jgi:cytochrome bd-type quinol oxidase subunit 2